MKKMALLFPLLLLACGKTPPPLATNGTPVATQGLPACNPANFPLHKGSSNCSPVGSAFQGDGAEEWHVTKTGGLAHRYLGPPCTSRKISCGMTLYYGPCGAAIDPNEDPAWMGGRDAKVFLPSSGHGFSYQVTTYYGINSQTVLDPDDHEPYTSQPLYPPVDATCRVTLCEAPGMPATDITVNVNSLGGAALGRVQSDPPGITLPGGGELSGVFPGDVTLIAEPTGKHVRAVFSGDCEKAGEYGRRAECVVKLAPDPMVTVAFECEKGFTCGKGSKD
jgi:hypothetical protein